MKAILNNYRQSPRKVRLVTDLIKGKTAVKANMELYFLPKRASLPIRKLLASAVANATKDGNDVSTLFVKSITVDKGVVLKRMMPRARGSGNRINKRCSNVYLTLGVIGEAKEAVVKTKAPKAKVAEVKKETKKVEKEVKSEKKVAVKKVAKKVASPKK